ncbi:hypothetical protein C8R46DRAFT_1240340 [Mycena filopes]|nr:hypothetical protein C8R46DRAFT_1240340 [Mycena filopes]
MVFDASKKSWENLRGSPSNYSSWKLNVEAAAKTHRLWRSVQGRQIEPEYADAEDPTAAERTAHDDWEDLRDQAAGMLWLCIEQDQQEHVKNVRADPVKMWDALEELHQAKTAAPRFTALINLLDISRDEDETLMNVRNISQGWRRAEVLGRNHELRVQASAAGDTDVDDEPDAMARRRGIPVYQSYGGYRPTVKPWREDSTADVNTIFRRVMGHKHLKTGCHSIAQGLKLHDGHSPAGCFMTGNVTSLRLHITR